jgi:RimJ/RimL family protein N-acetyltransferase
MNGTGRIVLHALTSEVAAATVAERRMDQLWAFDYPTIGDVNVAHVALSGKMNFVTDSMPWGLYVIVEHSSGLSIGGIGFKGAPNERGDVEIGYGVCRSFQGQGVATNAVVAICEIARRGASAILADTERKNVASQRVLQKCGFLVADENVELIRWSKDLATLSPSQIPPAR